MIRRLLAMGLSAMVVGAVAVAIAPRAAAGGGGCGERPSAARGTTVNIGGTCLRPTVLHAKVGDRITWKNHDSFKHVINGTNFRWGTFRLRAGREYGHTFKKAGVYPYSCYLHVGMNGAVVVGKIKAPKDKIRAPKDEGNDVTGGLGARPGGPVNRSDHAAGARNAADQPSLSQPAEEEESWASGLVLVALLVVAGTTSLYAFLRKGSRGWGRSMSSPTAA